MSINAHWVHRVWLNRNVKIWRVKLVDSVLRLLGWFIGETLVLSRKAVARYPETPTEELDVLEALHYMLLSAQKKSAGNITLSIDHQYNRFGGDTRITSPATEFVLPRNVLVPNGFPDGKDEVPVRTDTPAPHYRLDYRVCRVTMRAWEVIRADMPPNGCVTVYYREGKNVVGEILLGRYMIHMGELVPHPTQLIVTIT